MATTAFVSSGLEFVPNNYTAPLNTANAPEAFHMIQEFLAQSAIGRALVEPEKLSGSQIKAFWETGMYDDGGETGNPSIIFEYEDTEYVITAGTIRAAMGFPEFSSYTIGMGDEDLIRMMQEIGYSGPLSKIGQLKRPFLRKEWSFFFDCITRTFSKKCTNWDAIPTDSLQIGYSLLFDNHFDFARLVLNNLGDKMTENRGVVYFSRFCQTLFSYCVEGVEVGEEDVSCFKLHKRIFSDLINKDVKKGVVGDLLLPQSVQQFLNAQVNPPTQASSQPEPLQQELPPSTSVKPKRGGRTKNVGTKPTRVARSNAEAGVSRTEEMPQRKRMKKKRAQRAKSVAADSDAESETETDEENPHQRKRRQVAEYLFADIIANMDKVPEETEAPEAFVQEEAVNPEAVNQDRLNTDDIEMDFDREAPTSKANDVVEEAAAHSDSRIFDLEENVREADQATTELVETIASHTEIISLDFEKGEEVDQIRIDHPTEAVAVPADATENVPVAAEFVANSEDALVLEALQQSVVEIVQREAEVIAKANSDIPDTVAEKVNDEAAQLEHEITAEHVPEEIAREDDNVNASPAHSPSHISDIQANSDEEREFNRATEKHFQDMYFKNWTEADCIFTSQRAADLTANSVKEITNPELLSHFKATVVQIKSLNNRFDASDKVIEGLRNDIATRELTQQKDKSLYISLCKEQKTFNSRLSKVEENQTAMSAQLTSISNALELLTSVLLSDDVKKGESVPSDKCKDTQALRRRDDGNDGGSKGGESEKSLGLRPRSRSNSERRSNSGKEKVISASGSRLKSLINTDKPSTDEEVAAKLFIAEHGKDVTIEDIQAEEQMLAEEHRKNLEAGIYKKKEIKAPRKKETGIIIKENTQQSIQYTRRPMIRNSDKGKGKMIEEPNLKEKEYSTSDIAQVETRLPKSTSDAAQVDDTIEVKPASDKAQAVQTQLAPQLQGIFRRPVLSEALTLQPVDFSQTRTVLGKETFDKAGLGSHREKRINNRSGDQSSLAVSGIITQENLDMLDSVQLIFHKGLKKDFLLYFMNDGRVYRIAESDIDLKSYQELEYVLYLLKVKNRNTHNAATFIRQKMQRSKVMLGGGVSKVYIPKYRNAYGNVIEMKRNSARLRTDLGVKVLEFNLESDKAHFIRLGNEMRKNSIYSLRAAIYQTGESDPELKELKEIMVEELEKAERRLLIDYLRTVPDIQEIK
ncbi:hypothetical protein POM88_041415 [Heracleum sosnowskyi]|uniref:Uncharacterized protein n=1 Tax=Heracleum sosnowskyi TaxID=360622 RepID=A0AAD8MAR3_9APIA|nr:hypothetical protein POM88_041415 [Heracleum sosnowskyi]